MSFWSKIGDLKNNVGDLAAKTLSDAKTMAKDLVKNIDVEESQSEEMRPENQEEFKERIRPARSGMNEREEDANSDTLSVQSSSTNASSRAQGSDTQKTKVGSGANQTTEFRRLIEEKDQMIEKLIDDIEVLTAEKNGSQELVDKLKQKIDALQENKHLGSKSSQQYSEANKIEKHTPQEFLERDIVLPKSENIGEYIQEYMNQFRTEFYSKVIDNLNQDIIYQLEADEGQIPEDAKDLINMWTKKPEISKDVGQLISQEKLIQPLYNESSYKEKIEALTAENEKLKKQLDENQNRGPELEIELEQQKAEYIKYKAETENAYQKYADDIIKYEQDIEDLKEQLNKQVADLKQRDQSIESTQKNQSEYEDQMKQLGEQISREVQQREDAEQRYQVIVEGMKEFEMTVADLNQDNERLNGQIEQLKNNLKEEKEKMKKLEDYITLPLTNSLLTKLNKLSSLNKEINFEQLIRPKLIQENDRIHISSFNMALEDTLNIFMSETSQKINQESEEKKNKEKEKYETLSKNAIKLQAELKETRKRERELITARDKLKEENDDLLQKLDNSATSSSQSNVKINQLQKTINDLQESERRRSEELSSKSRENEQLKTQIAGLHDEDTAKNNYIAKLEKELAAIPELSTHMESQTMEMMTLRDIIESKSGENETLNSTIVNLQTIVDENQEVQEKLLGQYDGELKKLAQKLEEANNKNRVLEESRAKFEEMSSNINSYEERIKELDMKLRESEQEKNNVRLQAADIMKKAKSETLNKENTVDKRMLTTFLIKYFDVNASFSVKLQILETLSSILSFSEEERARIGLHRKRLETHMVKQAEEETDPSQQEYEESSEGVNPEENKNGGEAQGKAPSKPKSFTSMFMNFLKE